MWRIWQSGWPCWQECEEHADSAIGALTQVRISSSSRLAKYLVAVDAAPTDGGLTFHRNDLESRATGRPGERPGHLPYARRSAEGLDSKPRRPGRRPPGRISIVRLIDLATGREKERFFPIGKPDEFRSETQGALELQSSVCSSSAFAAASRSAMKLSTSSNVLYRPAA